MELNANIAIGLSVLMHVVWNLMARHQPSNAWPIWWVLLAHLVLLGPWGIYHLITEVNWDASFIALLTASALTNAVYFVSLKLAYDNAPVSLVYPMVRSSPLLIALWTSMFMGEQLGIYSWLGILVSVIGLFLMSRMDPNATDRRALPWAMAAMLCTSVYSITDKSATAYLTNFASVVGFISIGYLMSFISITLLMRFTEGNWMPKARIKLPTMVLGGICVGLAYALVVHAMRYLPSAEVVAYTNSGIVIATLASIYIFKERYAWRRRLLSAAIICTGLGVMSL